MTPRDRVDRARQQEEHLDYLYAQKYRAECAYCERTIVGDRMAYLALVRRRGPRPLPLWCGQCDWHGPVRILPGGAYSNFR